MDIKIVKENQISIGYVPNVTDMIELTKGRVRIVGKRTCDYCGHSEEVLYDTEPSDMIVLIPTLE